MLNCTQMHLILRHGSLVRMYGLLNEKCRAGILPFHGVLPLLPTLCLLSA